MQTIRCKNDNKVITEIEVKGTCTVRKKCHYCKRYNVIKIKDNKIIEHIIE